MASTNEAITEGAEEQPTSSTPSPPRSENETAAANDSPVKVDSMKLATNYLAQGKRYLVIKEFSSAIESLGEACRLLSEADGEQAKLTAYDNAEAHFFYGKALLEQSRMELGVFEGADLTKTDDASGDDSEEDEEKEEDDDDEEEGEKMEVANGKTDEEESSEAAANGTLEEKNDTAAEGSSTAQESAVSSSDGSGKTADESEVDLNAPSPSAAAAASAAVDNEQPSTSTGVAGDAVEEKQAEDEPSNLELAWEVLEVAKNGFRGLLSEIGKKKLVAGEKTEEETKQLADKDSTVRKRLAETHCSLGEVATESENYNQAIEEFKTGLEILSGIEGSDSREIAQYHFQMGLAYSFDKNFLDAIENFKKSVEIIENRIATLNQKIENKQTAKDLGIELDANSKPEGDEVQELTALLPELQEKIQDTIDAEKESKREEEESKKEDEIRERNSPVKNPNPPAANDISHLVKKKKKADDTPVDERPVKKLCTEILEPAAATAMDTSDEKKEGETTTNGNGHPPIAIDA